VETSPRVGGKKSRKSASGAKGQPNPWTRPWKGKLTQSCVKIKNLLSHFTTRGEEGILAMMVTSFPGRRTFFRLQASQQARWKEARSP
jgi:hypothetical protein